jgi:hypothetical protein
MPARERAFAHSAIEMKVQDVEKSGTTRKSRAAS